MWARNSAGVSRPGFCLAKTASTSFWKNWPSLDAVRPVPQKAAMGGAARASTTMDNARSNASPSTFQPAIRINFQNQCVVVGSAILGRLRLIPSADTLSKPMRSRQCDPAAVRLPAAPLTPSPPRLKVHLPVLRAPLWAVLRPNPPSYVHGRRTCRTTISMSPPHASCRLNATTKRTYKHPCVAGSVPRVFAPHVALGRLCTALGITDQPPTFEARCTPPLLPMSRRPLPSSRPGEQSHSSLSRCRMNTLVAHARSITSLQPSQPSHTRPDQTEP